MGVFARWVVGFGVFAVVFAFLGFGASVGWWDALCLTAPPWRSLGAHMPRVGALAWAVVLRAGLVGKVGRDMIVPPHTAWRAVPGCCVAWGERRGVWGARRVLTRARAHAERRGRGDGEGEPRGADRGGLAGGGGDLVRAD